MNTKGVSTNNIYEKKKYWLKVNWKENEPTNEEVEEVIDKETEQSY